MCDVQNLTCASVQLLTGRTAAKTLAVSLRTLRSLVQRGMLPAVRIGRSVRFDPADLRQLIDQRKLRIAVLQDKAKRQGFNLPTAAELERKQSNGRKSAGGDE